MKNWNQFKDNNVIVFICGIVILGIGFFGGMEYKAYQIRSAVQEGLKGISGVVQGKANTDTLPDVASANKLRGKANLEITSKRFDKGDYFDAITMGFKLTNLTDKDMKGVTGTMIFYDIFNKEIYRSSVSYDKGIVAQGTETWDASIRYNQFIESQNVLKNTELTNLKYVWLPTTIVYEDGTTDVE